MAKTMKEELTVVKKKLEDLQEYTSYKVPFSVSVSPPTDSSEHMEYLGIIETFYRNIFDSILQKMLSDMYGDLANPLNQREVDLQLKGAIYALSETRRWFEECCSLRQGLLNKQDINVLD